MENLGHEYVEIGGIKWATMNVGATSITDYGLFFQWGDTQGYEHSQVGIGEGKKYFAWTDYKYGGNDKGGQTKYNKTDGLTVLEASDDAAQATWGGNWRMPTTAEFAALGAATDFIDSGGTTITASNKLTTLSGVTGILVADKNDHSKRLFFPAVGFCEKGSVGGEGKSGSYWSSSLYTSDMCSGIRLGFNSFEVNWQNSAYVRYNGFAVRGVFTGEPKELENLTEEELSYSSNSAVVLLEGEYTLPVLINTHNLTLTFNSSNTTVATISSEGTITINGNGTTTISAVFAGNSTYNPKTISYVLVVDIVKYLDYKGLSTFKEKLDEEKEELENSISNVNTKVN